MLAFHNTKIGPPTTCACKHCSTLVVRVHRKTEPNANFNSYTSYRSVDAAPDIAEASVLSGCL